MNVTLIKKNGLVSVHTSFQKACEAYGWERSEVVGYKKVVPDEYKGFEISKQLADLTVPCMALRQFLDVNELVWSDYTREHEEDLKTVLFELGEDHAYIVEIELSVDLWDRETATDRGVLVEKMIGEKITSINRTIDSQGDEIKLDAETEEVLKSKLYEYLH